MVARRRIGAVLGSIRTRLAVFFFLITAIAIAVVYIYVTPSLQSRLETQQLKDTERLAGNVSSQAAAARLSKLQLAVAGDDTQVSDAAVDVTKAEAALKNPNFQGHLVGPLAREHRRAEDAARDAKASYAAREQTLQASKTAYLGALTELTRSTSAGTVNLLEFGLSAHGSLQPNDLLGTGPPPQAAIQVAESAFTLHRRVQQAINSGLGVVAVPVPGTLTQTSNSVFVYTVTFTDVASDVLLIRHRILLAAAIALAVVLLLGILVARALTVRVLRLERAAQRVAAGDLTAQFEVDANDELGQLAAALAHMQSQLRGLEEARRRFIAIASHELRTPIFSLGGFLELIQDEDLDEDTRRQFVGQVREQVERLGKLATGLLDLSRLEAGSVDLQPTPTDLGVLSRAVASEFVPALALHGSELDLDLPEQPLRAVVDPDRVAQLLRILIDNAISHTPPGTPVTVAVANGDGRVRLSVADHGPGIPDEVVGRIFEPFYSADGVQGAGLGLAIARELAERLDGSLEVRSASATTVFTLTLPGRDS